MHRTAKKIVATSAFALFAGTALTGVASAEEAPAPAPVTFDAVDNKDCTATFTVVNTTNSGMNKVVYWTGEGSPKVAPDFGKDEGSKEAILADAAFVGEDGKWYAPWVDGSHPEGYVKNLKAVETTEVVDFADVATAGKASVEAVYRMTGLEQDDYDTSLKTLTVTGCDTGAGILGSVDVFGSLGSADGSLGSLLGSKK